MNATGSISNKPANGVARSRAVRTISRLNPAEETFHLQGSQHMKLQHAAGWTVRALSGCVWITQDGDIRDVVLEAGQSIDLDRDALALFSPLGEASFRLSRKMGQRQGHQSVAPLSVPASHLAFA